MDVTWSTVVQSVILAVCTWYVRRGSKKDAASIKRTAQDHDQVLVETSTAILDRLNKLELDMQLIKHTIFKKDVQGSKPGLVNPQDIRHN